MASLGRRCPVFIDWLLPKTAPVSLGHCISCCPVRPWTGHPSAPTLEAFPVSMSRPLCSLCSAAASKHSPSSRAPEGPRLNKQGGTSSCVEAGSDLCVQRGFHVSIWPVFVRQNHGWLRAWTLEPWICSWSKSLHLSKSPFSCL